MDEELGVKAPAAVITRLRRRLSTEAEGAQSPLTPSTPTKKRSTKLAKPALELIDENVTESVPKKVTRRASAKDAERVEEKPVTPSRRSSRIRSNTSLLMEATQNIVSESPRAKRALRRNSHIGSDTEGPTTPARRIRARKDSTSSVEKLAVTSTIEKVIAQVAEPISEEPEKDISKDKLNNSQNSPPLRKSPRLNKNGKNNNKQKNENEVSENDNALTNTTKLTEDELTNTPKSNEDTSLKGRTSIGSISNTQDNTGRQSESKDSPNLSVDSAKLISEIPDPKKSSDFNKTISAYEELSNDKANRKRTKSWTTITTNDTPSDNISTKLASGDGIIEKMDIKSPNKSSIYNTSIENKENILLKSPKAMNAIDTIKILDKTPVKGIKPVVFMEDSDSNSDSEKLTMDMHHNGEGDKNDGGDQCVPIIKQATPKRLASESFTVEPMDIDETIPENVTFNDFSDKSNSSKEENQVRDLKQNSSQLGLSSSEIIKSPNKSTRTSNSLQHDPNNSKRKSSIRISEGNSDIDALDRSLTKKSQRKSSISLLYDNENSNKSNRKLSLSKADSDTDKRKSSTSSQIEEKLNESSNKSKRKSLSETSSHLENKSTLILTQLKDVSAETNNASKSSNDTNNDLSKSVTATTKETEKRNQSNYLTSTPLHQKPLQKLAMQINTSVISPNVDSKKVLEKASNISHDSDSSEESDDDSRDKNNMIDEEVDEASHDYESGDSRDEGEIQYEKDHEITEKGETLETESELSNDSDYEKDSFIVSSDVEDDALLSGSGDDLSLTDNELKMTAKSKKKFDERKRKEQKKASREMYEARHQLNESDKSKSKSKKSKGNKLESSASESETEETQPKKKNRLRIDSSQDVTMNNSDADVSVTVKKKKAKRLSESIQDGNPTEKEITIQNQSAREKSDPLVVDIKQEPKTPQKDFNMSTVLINEDIEEVQVDTNTTVMNPNETSDPLQATLAHEDSDSDISENMEIKENYDFVLSNLNKSNNKKDKVKMQDTSLNLNKKKKDTTKESIMDELNLTQTKSKKKKTKKVKDTTEKSASKIQDDDNNSDSIDMRLLFPEDSNDSELAGNKRADKNEGPAEKIIPLKKAEAKTNLLEDMYEQEGTHLGFFIDTKGDFDDVEVATPNSAKKNKKKNKQNVSVDNLEAYNSFAGPEEVSVNDSLQKDKKKKKNKSFEVSQTDEEPIVNLLEVSSRYEQSNFAFEEMPLNTSVSSDKKKRKKNKSLQDISQFTEDTAQEETPVNVSVNSDKKKKKNKSQLDISQIVEDAAPEEILLNVSVNSKKNKKNKSQLDISQIDGDAAPEETSINVSANSKKKKKKNKSQLDISQIDGDAAPGETPVDVSMNNDKKKKKKYLEVLHPVENTGEESDEAPMEVTYKSEKKSDNPEPIEDDVVVNKSKNKFKKKKKKNKHIQLETDINVDQVEVKVKKRKHEQSSPITDVFGDEIQMSKSQKKKKLSQHDDGSNAREAPTSKTNKREASEDDDIQRNSKVFKGNFFQKVHVSRLPESIVDQLDDQPTLDQPMSKESKKKKGNKAISTMPFVVEEGPKRKNKPSNYLEESVYLNDSISPVTQKKKIMNPKVLPFTPTVIISKEGFTSKFKINVLPQETQFIAQANNMPNFRDEYLSKQRTKKLRVEHYKKQRNHKLAKF